jgi:hypothetical protein
MPLSQSGLAARPAHHAPDLLGNRSNFGLLRIGDVRMVQRGRVAKTGGRDGETAFMAGILATFQKIDLAMVLLVNKGFGYADACFKSLTDPSDHPAPSP